jgi:hypothetical protein
LPWGLWNGAGTWVSGPGPVWIHLASANSPAAPPPLSHFTPPIPNPQRKHVTIPHTLNTPHLKPASRIHAGMSVIQTALAVA